MVKAVVITHTERDGFAARLEKLSNLTDAISFEDGDLDVMAVVQVSDKAVSTTVNVDGEGRVFVTTHLTANGTN